MPQFLVLAHDFKDADAPARRVTRSVSRASSASSDGVAGAAAGDATATSGAHFFAALLMPRR